jgi:hypothetical protein
MRVISLFDYNKDLSIKKSLQRVENHTKNIRKN